MIKEFHNEDAQKLADMMNASDEAWPGGFTHGMDFTAEGLLEDRKRENTLATYCAWDDAAIVGIAEITEFWRDTNVLYVDFLNVVPTHHGRGYGRDLLITCVEKATQLGSKRLDLHTWSGNMKAVPLYKKTGFFWVPKTLVYMRNFLPLILNLQVARPFFQKHNWYATFKRELEVEEDDFNGVYPYHWEEDGDILHIVIDAESGGVTQFENNDFAISQKVGPAFAGEESSVTWEIRNKTPTPLDVAVISHGDEGITIDFRDSFTVSDTKVVTATVSIDPDIEIRKKEEPPHQLMTDVIVNGRVLPLVSGLRVVHGVQVTTFPEYVVITPGEQCITVILKNNKHVQVEGMITCYTTGESHPFSISPGYSEGIPFSFHAVTDCELQFVVENSLPVHTVPVRVTTGGAVIMQKGKEVILENLQARIIVSLAGGKTSVYDKNTHETVIKFVSDELGPPYWPSELFKTPYTVRMQQRNGKVRAEFTAYSKKHSTTLVRRLEMDAGPMIKMEYSFTPQRDVYVQFGGETSGAGGILTLPLKEGFVSEPTVEEDFPLGHGDLPENPGAYKEQWMCYQEDESAFGVIWEKCAKINLRSYSFPGIIMDTRNLHPLYLYVGRGTWKDVRKTWSMLHNVTAPPAEPQGIWSVNPSLVMTAEDMITAHFTLSNRRKRPLKGTVNTQPFQVSRGSPFVFEATFETSDIGIAKQSLQVETDLFSREIPVTVVRAGKKESKVLLDEGGTIQVDNGLYRFEVAPSYYGSVIFWGTDVNHLLTPYPEIKQLGWLRPWYGGIHPIVFAEKRDFPGRMHKEDFSYSITERKVHDISWKGVTVTSTLQEIKGIQVETSYLTTGYSNILAICHTLKNLTSAPHSLYSGMSFYVQPDGSLANATLYYNRPQLVQRKRTPYGGASVCREWAAVQGSSTFLTVLGNSIYTLDMEKDGAHVFTPQKRNIPGNSQVSEFNYVVAARSLEESQAYRVLRDLQWD
ncbi:MAG: GNAT family N-acetyltransferase [Theionarchaea archaeon]|nr:GNAT family N-acetyltransferase [Theionarchaea archaeon]MBU7035802.1 GNAT family N-acetyltransferase [Theionarchaea archaeon]